MDLYLQSLSVSPWQLQRSTEGVPLSCSSLQLGLLARKSRLRSVRCSVVDGEGDTAQEKSAAKGLAPESWLQAEANADPYFGWTSDGSQTSDNSTAGWIKIGGGVVLAIGFALGARTMYTRKEAARQLGVLPPVTEQTVSPSKASKSAEVQDYLDGSRDMIDSLNSNQEEFMKQEKETQTDGEMPDVQHQEKSTPAGLPKMLGRVVVPAPVDHMQEQVLAALQALKVIEAGVEPGGICTRREYARWLILASATLSRSPAHKVFPAMYIENASKLAYDDVLPEDPDFPFIQGLAEAGLISSRLLGDDKQHEEGSGKVLDESNESVFSPDSPLTRQDLITWKVDFERKPGLLAGLPSPAQKEALQEISGFVDIDKIHQDAWPSLLADIKAGEQSIINLAFGYTRRFQPEKPVTKAQAAVALATKAWEHVSEELARLEAESIAEAAVAAELALETKAQQEVAAAFNELLQVEREKQQAAVSLVETVQAELQQAKAEREEEKNTLLKERAVLDSEKELLSNFKHEVEEQAMALSCAKLEVAFEREKVDKLHAEAEEEREMISKVQSELEIEKNALTLARAWAEDEARKALAHSKVLEQARKRWESQGVQVHVDKELDEMNIPGPSWHYSEGFKVQKSPMDGLITKSRDLGRMFVDAVMRFFQFIQLIFHAIKQRSTQLVGGLVEKFHEAKIKCADTTTKAVEGMKQTLPSSVAGMTSSIREGTLKAADEWKGGAEKLVHKFKLP